MSMLTDEEQLALLTDSTLTKKIGAIMMQILQGKIIVSADLVDKVAKTTERIECRQKQRTEADQRAWSAHLNTLKSNMIEE